MSIARMIGLPLLVGFACLASAQAQPPAAKATAPAEEAKSLKSVVVQGLDKVTARVLNLEITPHEPVQFGELLIEVRACWVAEDHERPEHAALLRISELRPGSSVADPIFSGWMFASSPALSALEHPVYDISLIRCVM